MIDHLEYKKDRMPISLEKRVFYLFFLYIYFSADGAKR